MPNSIASSHPAAKKCIKVVIFNTNVFQFTVQTCVNEVVKLLQDIITISFSNKSASTHADTKRFIHHCLTVLWSSSRVAKIQA